MATGQNAGFPPVAEWLPDEKEHRKRIAVKANDVGQGRVNCFLDVTLSSGTSTTVSDPRIGATTVFWWQPQTQDAANVLSSNGIYCPSSTLAKRTAVLNHAAAASTSVTRSFRLLMLG